MKCLHAEKLQKLLSKRGRGALHQEYGMRLTNFNKMKTLKFKTNINCSGCVSKVTPLLNEAEGIEKWEVNTNDSLKILTVETDELSAEEVKNIVNKAGFKAEKI